MHNWKAKSLSGARTIFALMVYGVGGIHSWLNCRSIFGWKNTLVLNASPGWDSLTDT